MTSTSKHRITLSNMTARDVQMVRTSLAQALSCKISQHDLGIMLGLSPATAFDTVKSWEMGDKGISGPAALALRLLGLAADLEDDEISDDIATEEFRDSMLSVVSVLLERAKLRD